MAAPASLCVLAAALGVMNTNPHALARWLFWEPRHIWFCGAALGLAAVVVALLGYTEPAIRLTGLALQLAGIVTVVLGVISAREFFGLPPVTESIRSWWRRRPTRKVHHASGSLSGSYALVSASGDGYASIPIDPEASLEEMIRVIQSNFEVLHNRITAVDAQSIARHKPLESKVQEHDALISNVRQDLSLHVKMFGTNSLHISAIGAVWLFAGAVLGAASPELYRWLQ